MSHAGMTLEQAQAMAASEDPTRLPELAANPLVVVPHTLAGFKGAFYCQHRRAPTEQEIFNAGVRSGIEREQLYIRAALA